MTVTIGRRELLAALSGAPLAAPAQQAAMPVIGVPQQPIVRLACCGA
jgi:hypothetical protein